MTAPMLLLKTILVITSVHSITNVHFKQVSSAADKPTRRIVSGPPCCRQMLTVSVINWWPRPSPVYHSDRPPKLINHLRWSAVPEICYWCPPKFRWFTWPNHAPSV